MSFTTMAWISNVMTAKYNKNKLTYVFYFTVLKNTKQSSKSVTNGNIVY